MDDFQKLENKMVRYRDLVGITAKESSEPFIVIKKNDIKNGYLPEMLDMKKTTGNKIIVRKSVYERLKNAQKLLNKLDPDLFLYVTYGYRSLEIQTDRFLKRMKEISTIFFTDPFDLYEETHRYVAVPTVAGHPTGGAVDLVIISKMGRLLDFGSKIYDYSTKNCYVFSENISREAQKNRFLLRKIMVKNGFAPFDGEWWHFSYGDREWAYYYNKPAAIYNQVISPSPEPRNRRLRHPI